MLTTLDVLYIVLSFCTLVLTISIFHFFWQMGRTLKNVNDTVSETKEQFEKIAKAFSAMKDRVDSVTSVVGLGINSVARIMDYVLEKKGRDNSSPFEASMKKGRGRKEEKG